MAYLTNPAVIASQSGSVEFGEAMVEGSASYHALVGAVGWAMHNASHKRIRIRTDSPGIVKQISDDDPSGRARALLTEMAYVLIGNPGSASIGSG